MFKRLLSLVLIIVISAGTAWYVGQRGEKASATAQDTLARVLETKTLRCGFVDYEPANFRDAKTNEMKGILYEVAEEIGKELGLKIEWVQAGGWATYISDLTDGKFDMFCGAAWAIQVPEMTRLMATVPVYYSAVSAWVRADDSRFDSTLANVNSPDVTIAATDGSAPSIIAAKRFPNAKIYSLPEMAAYAANLLSVAEKKADIGFVEAYFGAQYSVANPGTIKNITPDNPLQINPNVFEVRKGDHNLLSMVNMMLEVMHNNGRIDAIIAKYEPAPHTFWRRAPSFQR
ncbi:MAG: substrate-binding periplasmic protein [Bdellovibrionales bacterium]